ncbi:MAG: nucleoside 2-deoxyribosyltransferase [Candidatus Shapirobacteria bacterium]|nr:nucleoside 2-deoxyribosyltransferase [Candidatus Shapirobacteria bacterium]
MKIYFAGSITGGRNDSDLYGEIILLLKNFGDVLTEHIGNKNLSQMGEAISAQEIYKRDIDWVKNCDVLVAEVTNPSFGVGMEIARATEFNKRVICIYRVIDGKKLSAMISGCPGIEVFKYENIDGLKNIFGLNLK